MSTTFDYQEYLASREWALLKNQVRSRSGGTCERCHRAPHQSTHHKTYARIGRELIEDLLGVCNPCHEFLSGKRNDDPAAQPAPPVKTPPILNARGQQVRVYLAGKIGKRDWRHELFPGLRNAATNSDIEVTDISGGHHSYVGVRKRAPEQIEADGVLYGGPYFVGCDHGGFHGDGSHGQGADADVPCCATKGVWRQYILDECVKLISRADVVFCWLDSPDAYGTIFELGVAYQAKIPVFLSYPSHFLDERPPWMRDMWLAGYASRSITGASNPAEAWQEFIKYGARHLA